MTAYSSSAGLFAGVVHRSQRLDVELLRLCHDALEHLVVVALVGVAVMQSDLLHPVSG
jgi:hypothetical protein